LPLRLREAYPGRTDADADFTTMLVTITPRKPVLFGGEPMAAVGSYLGHTGSRACTVMAGGIGDDR